MSTMMNVFGFGSSPQRNDDQKEQALRKNSAELKVRNKDKEDMVREMRTSLASAKMMKSSSYKLQNPKAPNYKHKEDDFYK